MIRINLLPYRPERRKNQILQHLGWLFGSIALAAALLMGANMYGNGQLEDLQVEFGQLQAQNNILKKKIGKIRNLDRLRVDVERKLALVDKLQQGRFESLNTFAELSKVIPENVWLTSITDNAGKLKVTGLGESNKAVANFMRSLDQSPLFGDISLQVIVRKVAGGVPVRNFTMTFSRLFQAKKDASQGGKT
ncbi:MAG: PilN domain-containing protein [Mariprofundaceae bacterium]|nr:PilN domain-containing protein [Mariprofundaceae bacterium]